MGIHHKHTHTHTRSTFIYFCYYYLYILKQLTTRLTRYREQLGEEEEGDLESNFKGTHNFSKKLKKKIKKKGIESLRREGERERVRVREKPRAQNLKWFSVVGAEFFFGGKNCCVGFLFFFK